MSKNPKIRTAKEIEQIFNVLRVVMAIIIALLFAFLVILLVSDDPMGSISSFIVGPLTTFRRFGEVVSKVVPLLFTGAAVCFIFSANQTNMAVEGGFTVGALGATIIAVYVHPGNSILHIALCCIAGGVFGLIAAAIPAIMYVKFNAKPVVSSLMMNYVCMYIALGLINHPMRDNNAGFNASATFDATAQIPKLIARTDIHAGLIIGLVVIVFSYIYLYRSQNGYEIRVVGKNTDFATYCGMPVKKVLMKSQLIGGFLAGLGFDGIMVGIMAGYNPKLVPLAAFFYAYVKEGAAILARATDIPVELVSIIQAIIIMLVVAERFLYKQKHRMMVKAAEKELEFRNQQAAKEAE